MAYFRGEEGRYTTYDPRMTSSWLLWYRHIRLAPFSSPRVTLGASLWSAQYDVKDFLYRLRIDRTLASWLGLPLVRRGYLEKTFGKWSAKDLPENLTMVYFSSTVLPMVFENALVNPKKFKAIHKSRA